MTHTNKQHRQHYRKEPFRNKKAETKRPQQPAKHRLLRPTFPTAQKSFPELRLKALYHPSSSSDSPLSEKNTVYCIKCRIFINVPSPADPSGLLSLPMAGFHRGRILKAYSGGTVRDSHAILYSPGRAIRLQGTVMHFSFLLQNASNSFYNLTLIHFSFACQPP